MQRGDAFTNSSSCKIQRARLPGAGVLGRICSKECTCSRSPCRHSASPRPKLSPALCAAQLIFLGRFGELLREYGPRGRVMSPSGTPRSVISASCSRKRLRCKSSTMPRSRRSASIRCMRSAPVTGCEANMSTCRPSPACRNRNPTSSLLKLASGRCRPSDDVGFGIFGWMCTNGKV